jgi:hypothetical protein
VLSLLREVVFFSPHSSSFRKVVLAWCAQSLSFSGGERWRELSFSENIIAQSDSSSYKCRFAGQAVDNHSPRDR